MPRPPGRRNADFADVRHGLLGALYERLSQPDGVSASFRELAAACGVSVPTLRHYFVDRDGAVRAVLERQRELGELDLRAFAEVPLLPFNASMRGFLDSLLRGFAHGGLGMLHAVGLTAGLRHETIGPAYLAQVLEPSLQALEARLARHRDAGELRKGVDLRHAALALLAPPLLLLLHQDLLGGRVVRAADVPALVERHAGSFVRAFRAGRKRRRKARKLHARARSTPGPDPT